MAVCSSDDAVLWTEDESGYVHLQWRVFDGTSVEEEEAIGVLDNAAELVVNFSILDYLSVHLHGSEASVQKQYLNHFIELDNCQYPIG